MKYCYQCGKMTAGEPLYCGTCGRTYDVKLCPRAHVNPRGAEVCSQCGSRELSTPQPKIPMSWRLLALLTRLGLGILLFYVSLCFLIAVIRTPEAQHFFVAIGMLLAGLWYLFSKLPDWLQEFIRSIWKYWSRRNDD
jgi:RNA polymerase subunit RPABC4/transcription elongation factor Spt4